MKYIGKKELKEKYGELLTLLKEKELITGEDIEDLEVDIK